MSTNLNFVDNFSFLNVFKYLTFRTGLSFFTSLVIVLFIGGPFIKFFSNQKIFNPIRDDGPEDHIVKKLELQQWVELLFYLD